MIPDEHWAALCLPTETKRPHEQYLVAWVIRNRLEDGHREFRHLVTYRDVVLQRFAFSAFNPYTTTGTPDQETFTRVLAKVTEARFNAALGVLRGVEQEPSWKAPFSPDTLFFWSPRSMVPAGSLPRWQWGQLRIFSMPGVSPWRFRFAEYTEATDPHLGKPVGPDVVTV